MSLQNAKIPSILVIDNYDSFTFNLVHYLEDIVQGEVTVLRVDDAVEADIHAHEVIVFSPGPGLPEEFNNLLPLVKYAVYENKKVLGVCLGHQALAIAFGAKLKNLDTVYHGVSHPVQVDVSSKLFSQFDPEMEVGRYHSWVVDGTTLPQAWKITATDSNGEVMAMEHREKNLCGIQFHPESVLTPKGKELLEWVLNSWYT